MGQTFDLEDVRSNGSRPSRPATTGTPAQSNDLKGHQAEVAEMMAKLKELETLDPVEVMRTISSISARAREIQSWAWDNQMSSTPIQQFRTRKVDPLLEECERQFRYHSRLLEALKFDWEMSRGQ